MGGAVKASEFHTDDLALVARQFPILEKTVHGKRLAYLDSAATSQKPQYVLDAVDDFYRTSNANVHRGVHALSQEATARYEGARSIVRAFLGAADEREIIFAKGCTEAINLVAACLSGADRPGYGLQAGDVVLLSTMEHHSNIVPWQMAAARVGAKVVPIPISDEGEIDLDAYASLLKANRVRIVGIVHVSNALGTINPVAEMIRLAHDAGAIVLVDGAQAGPHLAVDVQELDADFYTLSCHKLYAPTGVGVLYGKRALLEAMPPYHGGGDMIRTVSFQGTTYAGLPAKFEAGTPNVAGVIGLAAALEWIASLPILLLPRGAAQGGGGSEFPSPRTPVRGQGAGGGEFRTALATSLERLAAHERALVDSASHRLAEVPGLKLVGTATKKAGIVSFTLDGVHPHDIGTILDSEGVAIRAGHHCCMPLMSRLGTPATARASFAAYSTPDDVDALVAGVRKVKEIMG